MLYIDALNKVVRAAGQTQVDSITDPNAAIAKGVLERELRSVLTGGFAFNTDKITLQVNTAGRVPVSNGYLKIRFRDGDGHLDTRKEAGTRYVWDQEKADWHDADTEIEAVFMLQFADVPEPFAQWIASKAALTHWHDANPTGIVNQRLLKEEETAQAVAINSLDGSRMNVYGATGWNRLAGSRGMGITHFNGRWIGLD